LEESVTTALAADPVAMIAGNHLAIDDELAPSAWDHMVWVMVIWDCLVERSGK
jgi:hypothetical protein